MATLEINAETCIGCGACTASAADLIEMKDGKAVALKADLSEEEANTANAAAAVCPVDAISVN